MKTFLSAATICLLSFYRVQAQSITAIAEKVKSQHNFTYTDILKNKFSFQETADVDTYKNQLLVVPVERQLGGYYRITGKKWEELFDGDKYIALYLQDSTYKLDKNPNQAQSSRSILYWAKQIEKYAKQPGQITRLADTVVNGQSCISFLVNRKDTIENNERLYWRVKLVAYKKTLLPAVIEEQMKDHTDDGALLGLYEQHTFLNYQLNKPNFPDLANAQVPLNFKLPAKSQLLPMLTAGTVAPKLQLRAIDGANFNMDDLKGKIILLNFTTIGCPHCANAAQMLARLNDKYGKGKFAIITIYQSNSNNQQAIAKFDARFNVKYPSYITDQDAHKDYHIQGYPNFYLLDKQGTIVNSFDGFYASLEKDMTEKIDAIK